MKKIYLKAPPFDVYVVVDDDDFEWLSKYRWSLSGGYAYTSFHVGMTPDGMRLVQPCLMHRFIMQPPGKMVVNHINENRLDNRKSNLEVCTQRDNMRAWADNRKKEIA